MKISNSKNYFKAGQTYIDALTVVLSGIIICTFFIVLSLLMGGGVSLAFNLTIVFLLLLIFGYAVFCDAVRFSHRKKVIISFTGVLLLEKQKNAIQKECYSWESISKIEYLYCRHVKSVSNCLYITMVSYSSGWKGTTREEKTILIDLSEYLSFREQYSLAQLSEWFRVTVCSGKKSSNGYDVDLDSVLSTICKATQTSYMRIS